MNEITKSQIGRIGKAIKNNSATDEDLNIFSKWRSDHVLLTRDLAKTLRRKAGQNKLKATISRRLKRQPSIFTKLTRFPKMQLDRMQDIGGVRIILKNINDANNMSNILSNMYGINKKNSMFTLKKPITDYITNPKKDGYRSIHHIYLYTGSSKKAQSLIGFFIELQVRTEIQHMWATTLEIFDIRSNSSLKTGSGEEEHREFFQLCSLIFAFLDNCITKQEKEHFDINTIYARIQELNDKHNIINVLQGLKVSIQHIDNKTKCDFFILELNLESSMLTIHKPNSEIQARTLYSSLERDIKKDSLKKEVVMVSAEDIKAIKKAYPNYFLDSEKFVKHINNFLQKKGEIWKKITE